MKKPTNLSFTKNETTGILIVVALLLLLFVGIRVTRNSSQASFTPPPVVSQSANQTSSAAPSAARRRYNIAVATPADFRALGFSEKQVVVILKYRQKIGGFKTLSDFQACYVVNPGHFARIKSQLFVDFPGGDLPRNASGANTHNGDRDTATESKSPSLAHKTPLNSADSAALVRVKGIGALTAGRIVSYRQKLGGFVSVDQLREVFGVTPENFIRISQQIFIDNVEIKKIDINFADANRLSAHPYFTPSVVRRVLKARQLKGGWSNFTPMIDQDILLPDEVKKLTPYVVFGLTTTPNSKE